MSDLLHSLYGPSVAQSCNQGVIYCIVFIDQGLLRVAINE